MACGDARAAPTVLSAPVKVAGTAGAGGGLPAVSARIDAAARKIFMRACPGSPCEAVSGGTDAIAVGFTDTIDLGRSSVQEVDVGGGRRVLRVIVASENRTNVAWEAILAGETGSPNSPNSGPAPALLWQGATGVGAEGEGAGRRVNVAPEGERNVVWVGRLRRELTLCGQAETLLDPQRLDPKSMKFHRVAMHRLPQAIRNAAPTLVAEKATERPVGSVLAVRGASVNDGASPALADDDPSTAWFETQKGDGKGEFVVFSAPKSIPIEKLSLVVRPTKDVTGFAQPLSLWLTTDTGTVRIAIEPVTDKGGRVDVVLPKPIATSCLALSIDRAEDVAEPTVGLAEVDAVPLLPKTIHALEDLVTLLDVKGPDGDLAETVLANAGARGARAILAKVAALGDLGKARAVEALEAAPCEASSAPLARLAWDAPRDTAKDARVALDACGKPALPAIAAAFAEGPDAAREALAERYGKLDPKGALGAVLAIVKTAPATRRRTYRVALGRIATTTAGREAIGAWLATPAADTLPAAGEIDVVIELGRAIAKEPELGALAAAVSKTLRAHAGDGSPFDARWLAAEPLAALAARGDAGALAWLRALHTSKDRYLRARAAQVSTEIDALRPEVITALKDADPRVRQLALVALRSGNGPTGGGRAVESIAMQLLAHDAWTYVRVAAAETLGEVKGAAGDVDEALAKALEDLMPPVRSAAIRALVTRGARSQLPAIRKRAFDVGEVRDVRKEAIEALGLLCDAESVDDLTDLAKRGGETSIAAIDALGHIHPKDLASRLAGVDQTPIIVKQAVRQAMRTPSTCK